MADDDGTLRVPFSHRHDSAVALQHSRTHGGLTEALQEVTAEQFSVQPAVHCIWLDNFFSWTQNKTKCGVKNRKKGSLSANAKQYVETKF